MTEDDALTSPRPKILDLKTPEGSLRDRSLEKFVTYWTSMRRNGDVPLRTEIDPRGIESLLGNAFIAEKIAPGLARLRIAGSHLADIMGMEVRGMPLSALIEPEDRQQLADAVVELFERPAQIRLDLVSAAGLRRAPMTATVLILPLRSDLGDISRAVGCLVSTGPIGLTPRRFKLRDVHITPIALPEDDAAAGFAEPPAPFAPNAAQDATQVAPQNAAPPPEHPSERSYLRLVKND